MKPYDYAHRKGVLALAWDDIARLTAGLVEKIEGFEPEIIVGIARAGLFPATLAACMLRCEHFPVRITRRENDEVVYSQPVWKTPLSVEVSGRRLAIFDEIADTGQTLAQVKTAALAQGASQAITACLVSHPWADPLPDYSALVSDALVLFPWDRQVRVAGRWQLHPELIQALAQQGRTADEV